MDLTKDNVKIVKTQRLAIALLVCAMAGSARADTAARINAANEWVRQGDFAKAIEDYPEIAATDPNQDDLNYNLGVAHYRHGDIEAAKPFFRDASTSGDASIAAAARYNLGNCFYSDATATADQNKPSAIESLTQAILHYRASLRANPGHVDARANIELAVQLRDTLTEEQEQQDQQDSEQPSSQSQQNQESQENQESSSETGDSDQQQDQDAPSEDPQSGQEQSQQDRSNENDETSEQEQSAENGQQQSDQPSANGQSPSAQDDQSAADQASEEPSLGEKASDEPAPQAGDAAPAGEFNAANEQPIHDEMTPDAAAAKEGLMTREEALKMLQAVRDRDMLRRLRQEQLERRRHVPTERDW